MTAPRERQEGALPEVELAILGSDVHHLAEEVAENRKAFAARMSELRGWRERIELSAAAGAAQVARLADTCDRMEVARKADAQQLGELVALSHKARGAFWVLASLATFAGFGTLVQLVKGILR